MKLALLASCLMISSCGVVYFSPSVKEENTAGLDVQVIDLTAETVDAANRFPYQPRQLPGAFFQVAGGGTIAVPELLPSPPLAAENKPASLEARLPPEVPISRYQIGVDDVILVRSAQSAASSTVVAGEASPQNQGQLYTVQEDGSIALPDVGRVKVVGLTVMEAENAVFEKVVASNLSPSVSLEVAEFNSRSVAVGGAVGAPGIVKISSTPLTLADALAKAGGVTAGDVEFALARIFRNGALYQVPLADVYSDPDIKRLPLQDGDSVFVDTEYDLERAQAYFAQQIQMSDLRQKARQDAVAELARQIDVRRAELDEVRTNFKDQLELGAIQPDFVYLTGAVASPSRFPLPFGQRATLADALYDNGGFEDRTANPQQIYVLRGSTVNPTQLTALHLDAVNAVSLILATRLELRPNDIIFMAEQPITRWNNVLSQVTPTYTIAGQEIIN
jgi:polysaccharide export outer membrane protein